RLPRSVPQSSITSALTSSPSSSLYSAHYLRTSTPLSRYYTTEPKTSSIIVDDSAAKQLNLINSRQATPQLLRVAIDSGGCHGYQYVMTLTNEVLEDDIVFEKNGAKVVVDTVSLDLIAGSSLQYVQELIGSSFQVIGNPKAASSCGCKTSFGVAE
ncbi:hypothetical protein BC829DRAFT_361804, partial [Chytridium lagenaria]